MSVPVNYNHGQEPPAKQCPLCGSPVSHVFKYVIPTMACIEYLREKISELEACHKPSENPEAANKPNKSYDKCVDDIMNFNDTEKIVDVVYNKRGILIEILKKHFPES